MGDATAAMTTVDNYINGSVAPPSSGEYLDVVNPSNSAVVGKVALSAAADVDAAVSAAHAAFGDWSSMTVKARAAIMLKFHALVRANAQELARCVAICYRFSLLLPLLFCHRPHKIIIISHVAITG